MSIEGISNYQHLAYINERPEWQKLERYDFCDQDILPERNTYLGKFVRFVRHLMGE